MNIGIIVYSQTGHTYSVAGKIKESLSTPEKTVQVERLKPVNATPANTKGIQFESLPDLQLYDLIVFGAPVQGFSLAPVMKEYLGRIPSLRDKKVACFVTKRLASNWTGGNKAIRQIKKLCKSKDATVSETAIIKEKSPTREDDINDFIERLKSL